jgi:hypothetical protein
MADILDLDMYRKSKPLADMTDPCAGCAEQTQCHDTCDRAQIWWERFAKKFKRQGVINQLEGV